MKQLILIRHAKSSWDDLAARDFDRDLSGRGLRDAPEMGRRLAERGLVPDALVISASRRTRATAALLVEPLGLPDEAIEARNELYLASPDTMLKLIRHTPDHIGRLAMLAHNPGITELANRLSESRIDNIPTCGVAIFELPVDSWRDAGRGGRLLDFDYPKRQQR
ncbi:phosphohistidine phosphatase [Mariprofundus ferrinatatus]|jgi:phosphohistidine phosphatase|uniref:Phosphohistidine phosphatase n=1 Tax=Mariprofundus ferrinatatus TaxID=1921087 RepID=A0A2K8L9S1_9PROT|nr:histidine phosphatase family protein [Mariprofundus ferrinatatus]ATX82999.1 phosphohistidine phosphatase [Mariprofundus ferrinatatus]